MKLRHITSYKELALFTPLLRQLHADLDGKWETELSADEFIVELVRRFDSSGFYCGDIVDGELAYFLNAIKQDDSKVFCWIFYMNKKFRTETKQLLLEAMDFLRSRGFKTVYTQSTRTEKSYERWVEKFGAKKLAVVFKFNLT